MSKSEGTSYLISDIIDHGFEPLVLRYFFLQAHYRSKQNFTWDGLTASQTAYRKLKTALSTMPGDGVISESYQTLFHEMINDDLNTAGALAVVWELLKNSEVSDADKKATILDFDRVLGLKLDEEPREIEIPSEISELLDERSAARADRDWKRSDEIRDRIAEMGFSVKDTDDGQKISRN